MLNSKNYLVKMGPPRIAVRAHGNFDIKVLGCYQTCCRWKEVKHRVLWNITNANKCPILLSYKTSVRMGLVKFINQIRAKIVEEANSHHFQSIDFQFPIQAPATTLMPDQASGQPRHPNYLKVCSSSQGSGQLSVHSMTNQVNPPASNHQCSNNQLPWSAYQGRVLTEHADVFQGLGKVPGPLLRLHSKECYKAASSAIHKVPVHMEKGFAEDVENMVNQDIIRSMRDDR